jgi:uncharacterized protein (TIGR02217 family)
MSSFVFPALLGQSPNVLRTPVWKTNAQTALSGKQSALGYRLYPTIHFELEYELLNDSLATSDLKALMGLFNAVKGRFDTFLFTDPDYHAVTAMAFGTVATGVYTYQLTTIYENSGGPGYQELVQNLNGTPTLYANGTAISGSTYSIGPTGIVTFSTLPTVGYALTWTGSFYYRCRFDDDQLETTKFMKSLWSLKKLGFTSVKL